MGHPAGPPLPLHLSPRGADPCLIRKLSLALAALGDNFLTPAPPLAFLGLPFLPSPFPSKGAW